MLPPHLQKYSGLIDLIVDVLVREIEEEAHSATMRADRPDPLTIAAMMKREHDATRRRRLKEFGHLYRPLPEGVVGGNKEGDRV